MSIKYYLDLCTRYSGRIVEIRTNDGSIQRATIERVDEHCVYLRPLGDGPILGDFSFGFGLLGLGAGIALGSIVVLTLMPLFFCSDEH